MTTAHTRLNHGLLAVSVVAAFATLLTRSGPAQTAPDAAATVAHLRRYLDAYEPILSALVADEVFEQRTTYVTEYGIRHVSARRRLASDVGFLRLPGDLAWLGQRSVRTIDDRLVGTNPGRLDAVFTSAGSDVLVRAKAIADANARFNLGHPRSMNVPTLPLDLLGRRRSEHFDVTTAGPARVGGRSAVEIRLRERAPGRLIALDHEQFARTDVRAWVGDEGALLRADVTLHAPSGRGSHDVRVDFAFNRALGALVPVRLTEVFTGEFSGDGTATYRNYRRFQTTARLVPPPGPGS